jgi:hypothetical protein
MKQDEAMELLREFVDAVERTAFELPPMNVYTPRLVQLCAEARNALLAQSKAAPQDDGWKAYYALRKQIAEEKYPGLTGIVHASAAPDSGEGSGDWPEDFSSENGNYFNACAHCGKQFRGYKRRVSCKLCASGMPFRGAPAVERRNYRAFAARILGQERYDNSPCQAHPLELIEQYVEELRTLSLREREGMVEVPNEEDRRGGWKISPKYLRAVKSRMVEYPDTDWEVIEDVLLSAAPPAAPAGGKP